MVWPVLWYQNLFPQLIRLHNGQVLYAGPPFFAYAANYTIDIKYSIILDVEASRAIRQAEVGAARIMIDRIEERF